MVPRTGRQARALAIKCEININSWGVMRGLACARPAAAVDRQTHTNQPTPGQIAFKGATCPAHTPMTLGRHRATFDFGPGCMACGARVPLSQWSNVDGEQSSSAPQQGISYRPSVVVGQVHSGPIGNICTVQSVQIPYQRTVLLHKLDSLADRYRAKSNRE